MGLFNRNIENKITEKTYEENGYVIGMNSHIIYHVPKIQLGSSYVLPNGTTGLKETAISEMRVSKPQQIIVPGTFKKFNVQFINFENLKEIKLQEGVEEVKCTFDANKNAVNITLPTTIKKIGRNNYPVVQHLNLPSGVTEIEQLFASHDTNLLSVNIPSTIKIIPQGAFNQCKNLEKIVFNEGVETSEKNVFRGTNNLHTLEIPSTYNGVIDLPMEARAGSNIRGNSKYDGKRFEEEKDSILKIKIKRGPKEFEFNIKRGEEPSIYIMQNRIQIKCKSQQQAIYIDCDNLKQGIYNVENGVLTTHKQTFTQSSPPQQTTYQTQQKQTTNQSQQQKEITNKLELIFQKAVADNLDEEDFKFAGIYGEDRNKVIKYMWEMFSKQASHNIVRTDNNNIDRIFTEAIRMLEEEKEKAADLGHSRKGR